MAGDLTFNKYAAALLATALGFMIIKEVSHGAMHVEKTKGLSYPVGVDFSPKGPEADKPLPFPQEDWVLAMDAEKGKKYFQACSTCHTVTKGGDNLQGPNLWGVVGRKAGSIDYSYSAGMKAMDINWGYEELDTFLRRPAKYVKNTKMGYGGEGKPAKRAALIEYLRTLSDDPMARPEAAAAPAAEGVTDISAPAVNDAPKVVETVTDKMDTVVEDVKDGAGTVMDKAADIAGDVKDSAAGVVDKAAEMAGDVKEGISSVAEDVKDVVKTQIDEGDDMIPEGTVIDTTKEPVKTQIDEGNDMIPEETIVDKAKDAVKTDD